MKIHEVLSRKGQVVHTIAPDEPVSRAIRLLVNHGVGSLVVVEGDVTVGIITERDVLRLADRKTDGFAEIPVAEVMTRDLVVVDPGDNVAHVMEVMTQNRVRHLPVMEGGALRGIISIGDVVNELRRDAETEREHLKRYVQGMVR
jgi:CBS domain-containing protein